MRRIRPSWARILARARWVTPPPPILPPRAWICLPRPPGAPARELPTTTTPPPPPPCNCPDCRRTPIQPPCSPCCKRRPSIPPPPLRPTAPRSLWANSPPPTPPFLRSSPRRPCSRPRGLDSGCLPRIHRSPWPPSVANRPTLLSPRTSSPPRHEQHL
ncbi:DBF4-type zinc finger-containing protein 2 homolog [Panicum virgatum]|uniref:DBF4-type zinc finger-containing protein 2 homolog n=1 Tax=Panicum virgatum TaxID=38727 RepID=UPI0019D4F732|nr:DBF4-type zinc finger-containing protein 2 homolog [Panicum virgatum]